MNTRRNFLKNTALAAMGMTLIPETVKATVKENAGSRHVTLKKDSIILFQGDSITDAGRKREAADPNSTDMLGMGYPLFTAASILQKHAGKQPKIYNRGISGNKVFQLRERWETDTLAYRPDILSILIGVNDYWHTLTGGYKGTAEIYENDLRSLLKYTREKLPAVQLIICEPFILKGGSAIKENEWLPMFNDYRIAAKKLAAEFKATFVPFQAAFEEALKTAPASHWSSDGVHPNLPGRQLMAETWLKTTGL
jgi:lysophospholipase L1-like esterase